MLSLLSFLLFFYDESCAACHRQGEELVRHRECVQKQSFYAVDVRRQPEYARQWRVYFTPTLIYFDGQSYHRAEGLMLGQDLRRFLRCY